MIDSDTEHVLNISQDINTGLQEGKCHNDYNYL